jgi:hypothetical protein
MHKTVEKIQVNCVLVWSKMLSYDLNTLKKYLESIGTVNLVMNASIF